MNLSWIDWTIIAISVVALRYVSLSTRSYMKGVADFLSANRAAGRYLLTIASQMGGVGVVSFVGAAEMTFSAGLPPTWWALMGIPGGVIIMLTGWVFYRFRETRALTMAQFFEMRYSKRFRIFAGLLCWTSGVLNFGIFPAVAARFFIYFCGLPEVFHIPGLPFAFSTFATVMIIDLGLALSFVTMGGQISVMITECVQGIFCTLAFVVVSGVILLQVSWPRLVDALSMGAANASLIHPFHTSAVKDFNIWYFLIAIFGSYYGYMSWQGTQGFYSSARSPHEQKMGGIISTWRYIPQALMMLMLPLGALAVMNLPEFSHKAALVNEALRTIPNQTIQGQMRVPIAMAHLLPIGIKGLLATIMLFVSFTCHDTYMHSWGSILVQDVLMPLRKRPLTPEQHIRMLRWSIIGVAVFAFLFSLLYPQSQKILFFFAITGTIWNGGAGSVIIGGLYWRRGTTAGAYCALIFGAVLGVGGLIVPELYKGHFHKDFPVNGQWLWFIAMVGAIVIYWAVSMVTGRAREPFNLERMLHRGRYKLEGEHQVFDDTPRSLWLRVVGITPEFSRSDRVLAIGIVVYYALLWGWFAVFSVINLLFPIGDAAWAKYWHFHIVSNLVVSIPAAVWFTIGGILDIAALIRKLGGEARDHTDDGRVMSHEEIERQVREREAAAQDRLDETSPLSVDDQPEIITR